MSDDLTTYVKKRTKRDPELPALITAAEARQAKQREVEAQLHLVVRFTYTNYRGETAERLVRPEHIFFGSTEHHADAQWLLAGYDLERQAERIFALRAVRDWRPA